MFYFGSKESYRVLQEMVELTEREEKVKTGTRSVASGDDSSDVTTKVKGIGSYVTRWGTGGIGVTDRHLSKRSWTESLVEEIPLKLPVMIKVYLTDD